MTGWLAIGAIVLFTLALAFSHWAWGRHCAQTAIEQYRQDQAENRARRRLEARAEKPGKRLAPFPGDDEALERLTTTGELATLTAAAESGDMAEIGRQNAAFFRRLDLRRWVRAA